MTEHVKKMLEILKKRDYRSLRQDAEIDVTDRVNGKNPYETGALMFQAMLEQEKPLILEDDDIGFNRTQRSMPFYRDASGEARGKDISEGGAVYNNYGCHGAGISTAADSLAAVKKAVYEEKICSAEELLAALASNFRDCPALQGKLLSYPKMGNNDDYVDSLAAELMEAFSAYLNGKPNQKGGIFRAGTGSAMEYILSAAKTGATPDGRKTGQPYGSSFSPSINARLEGPLSCIQSFT